LTTLTRMLTALALAAVAGLLLAACGGSDSPQVANLGNTTAAPEGEDDTSGEETDPQEAILAFTRCMRENGVDVPDPDFSGDGGGGPRFRARPGGGDFDPNDPDFQAAQEKCRSHLEGIQGRFDPESREAFQDAALEFAQCMRDQGIDVPDPDFSQGPGGGGGLFGADGIDPSDPDFQAAQEECRHVFEDLGIGPPGGGEEGAS
jgi:hypothetical protein